MANATPTSSVATCDRRYELLPVPRGPQTASPVPWLTSIHATVERGCYGDARYRGNCGGYLIKDLLSYFRPNNVLDPMAGSGTSADVCRELDIECDSFDIRTGFNAADRASFRSIGPYDFIWMHPPYWRMIRYNDDPQCLSNAPTLSCFLARLQSVIRNCRDVLADDGKLAILMGNYTDRGRYVPLTFFTMQRAIDEGLWPACTDIIRVQHGNTSSGKCYRSSFIPGLHDVCMVFQPDGRRSERH